MSDNDEEEAALAWFALPDRDDEEAVDAWFAAVALHHAAADARCEADVDACIELVADIAALLSVDMAKAKAKRGPVC